MYPSFSSIIYLLYCLLLYCLLSVVILITSCFVYFLYYCLFVLFILPYSPHRKKGKGCEPFPPFFVFRLMQGDFVPAEPVFLIHFELSLNCLWNPHCQKHFSQALWRRPLLFDAYIPRQNRFSQATINLGSRCLRTVSSVTIHFTTSVREGISYITSRIIPSMIARKPRAPVSRRIASSAMASKAPSSNSSST